MALIESVDRTTEVRTRGAYAGVGAVERSRNVDIVRAAAALAVLFGHSYQLSGVYLPLNDRNPVHLSINNGAAGVWFFFALSGYLIAGPFVRALVTGDELPPARGYAIRRVARIYPAYIVALAIVFAFGLIPGVHPRWWQYPLHFSLLHNLWPGEEQAIMFASWTLTLEMMFYLLVPIVASSVRRFRAGPIPARTMAQAIGVIWIGSILWTAVADSVHNPTYGLWLRFLIPSVLSMFCSGILVSLGVAVWRRDGQPPTAFQWLMTHRIAVIGALVPLVVAGAIGSTVSDTTVYDFSRQAYALAAGLVVLLAITIREPRGVPGRFFGWFGFISYGIYLWQAVIVGVIEHHGVNGIVPMPHTGLAAYLVHLVFLLALVLPAAWLSWVMVEQPMIRWAKARTSARRLLSPAPATPAAG